MKVLNYWMLVLVLFLNGCGPNINEAEQKKMGDSNLLKVDVPEVDVSNGWSNDAFEHIRKIEPLFPLKNHQDFHCSLFSEYRDGNGTKVNTSDLHQVDSSMCLQLFDNYSNDFGYLCGGYLFSIEKSIHDFYPITLIQYFGSSESPLVMILFNSDGKVMNSLVVCSDYHGEGCLNSSFKNDSTLIRTYEWSEITVGEENEEDIWETTYMMEEVIITSSGKLLTTELKRWTEGD